MKKLIIPSIVFVLFFSSCDVLQEMIEASTQQQQQPERTAETGPRNSGEMGDVKTRDSKDQTAVSVKELSAELGLNETQARRVTALTDNYNKDLVSIRANSRGDSAKMNTDMRARRTKYGNDLKQLLSSDQIRKYDAYLKKKTETTGGKMQRTN